MPDTTPSVRLGAPAGASLVLTIDGYQFQSTRDADDANWLVVRGQAGDGLRSWKFVDACLQTYELTRLAAWFRAIEEGETPAPCRFVSPNLALTFVAKPGPALSVRLAHGAAPVWVKGEARLQGVTIAIPLPRDDAARAAVDLDALAVRFPVRGSK